MKTRWIIDCRKEKLTVSDLAVEFKKLEIDGEIIHELMERTKNFHELVFRGLLRYECDDGSTFEALEFKDVDLKIRWKVNARSLFLYEESEYEKIRDNTLLAVSSAIGFRAEEKRKVKRELKLSYKHKHLKSIDFI